MSYMFYFLEAVPELDLGNFNTSKVTNMGSMFGAAGMFHDHGDLEGVDLDGDGIADVH